MKIKWGKKKKTLYPFDTYSIDKKTRLLISSLFHRRKNAFWFRTIRRRVNDGRIYFIVFLYSFLMLSDQVNPKSPTN